jgi:hypothetical protein
MADRKTDMQTIFAELSEKNKDIMLLVAKGMKAAQESTKQMYSQAKPTV